MYYIVTNLETSDKQLLKSMRDVEILTKIKANTLYKNYQRRNKILYKNRYWSVLRFKKVGENVNSKNEK
jgi:hypothetical protein